mmetsp:Transcript_33118/g.40068  ORF Transcript_33118/g.40068 Transcript_33118/m.40068 type:complete len:165 (-) Transcript_33118:123-617(-)
MGLTQSVVPNHPELYYCCRYERDYKKAIDIVSSNPDDATYRDFNSETILHHLASQSNPPLDTIKVILEAYPGALNSENKNGRTPLHIASYCSSPDVVAYFVTESPITAKARDSDGLTPLDLAIIFHRKDNAEEIISACAVHDMSISDICTANSDRNLDSELRTQ